MPFDVGLAADGRDRTSCTTCCSSAATSAVRRFEERIAVGVARGGAVAEAIAGRVLAHLEVARAGAARVADDASRARSASAFAGVIQASIVNAPVGMIMSNSLRLSVAFACALPDTLRKPPCDPLHAL